MNQHDMTRNMVLAALFAALTAIGAFLQIPTGTVPITLQFLFTALAGLLLGWKWGAVSQLLYVGIGLLGLPVFTQGGGIGYVLQPSFGFLLGLIPAAAVIGRADCSSHRLSEHSGGGSGGRSDPLRRGRPLYVSHPARLYAVRQDLSCAAGGHAGVCARRHAEDRCGDGTGAGPPPDAGKGGAQPVKTKRTAFEDGRMTGCPLAIRSRV